MIIDTPEIYIGCDGCAKQNTVYCEDRDSLRDATYTLYDDAIPYHYSQMNGYSVGGSDGDCRGARESDACPKSEAITKVLLGFANNDKLIVER